MGNSEAIQIKIQEILAKSTKDNYIFRGETEEYEKVSSGLYRQYFDSDKDTPPPKIDIEYLSPFTIEKDIVEEVKGTLPAQCIEYRDFD